MKERGKYYQLIPQKVYQNLATIEDLIKPEIKGFSPDFLKEVISIIAYNIRRDKNWTPLQMKLIKRLVPQGDKYLSCLMNLNIVERTGHAIIHQACYKYRFTPEYQSKFITVSLINNRLIYRIEKEHQKMKKESAKTVRGYSHQIKFLHKLTIDESFREYIDSSEMSIDKYNNILGSAIKIINKDFRHSVDNTSGRFHSNLTNMSKDLRPFLRISDEPLANIDVKNSQPYLSTILLTNPGKVSWMTNNPAFALLLQTLKVSLNQDVKDYINFVVSGQIYEYLMAEFRKEGMYLTRVETKIQMLRILFARNRTPKDETNRSCRMIFRKNFPTVHRIFSKVRGHEKGDKFSNFKRFAILLQKIESHLMLDIIMKRIHNELPGTIAMTIHDSIMTGILTDNVEKVRRILVEELTNFVGFPPQTKIERYSKEEGERGKEKEERRSAITNQYGATTLVSCN